MGTEPLNYHFDSQLRRYAMQFTRIFQNLQYQTGRKRDGEPEFRPIPVKFALNNRHVATILQQNSENVTLSIPMIACDITEVAIARDRTQAPFYVEKKQILERKFDNDTQMYTDEVGSRYQLDRIMPVPLNLTLKATIWTSNRMQRDQIFEQIMVLFNPSIDLQHSQNPHDWGGLTIIEMINIDWSSRNPPIGTSDDIELMSLTFTAPIWLQPPSWLHPQKLIEEIVLNIHDLDTFEAQGLDEGWDIDYSVSDLMARVITTPGNHQVRVIGDEITLLGANGAELDDNGNQFSWANLILDYGSIRQNISQIRLKTSTNLDDESTDIIGTFILHPTEANKLIWYIDGLTLPVDTLTPITGILDPHRTYPGHGLPIPQAGHRFLLTDDITDNVVWGTIDAKKNDIIEWDVTQSKWVTVFVSSLSNIEYVQNTATQKQLKWDGNDWIFSVDGEYNTGFWRMFL